MSGKTTRAKQITPPTTHQETPEHEVSSSNAQHQELLHAPSDAGAGEPDASGGEPGLVERAAGWFRDDDDSVDWGAVGAVTGGAAGWLIGEGVDRLIDGPAATEDQATGGGAAPERRPSEMLRDSSRPLEERVGEAEAARKATIAELGDLHGLSEEEAAVVRTRMEGLEGEALVQEMAMVRNAMEGPNGGRALHTLAGLQTMLDENEGSAERLNPEMVDMLVSGVADRRSDSDRGQEGVLGARQARDAASGLLSMTDKQYESFTTTLHHAGTDAEGNAIEGADAGAEQALVLKALAGRSDELMYANLFGTSFGLPDSANGVMGELDTFASDIRGEERDALLRTTTTIDIHDENTSTRDPNDLSANNDTLGDNDGLYQRWGDSCGPTTAQIVRGEADPIYARRLHDAGFDDPSYDTEVAAEQRRVLEANGGNAVSRLGSQVDPTITNSMDALQDAGTLSDTERASLDYLTLGMEQDPETLAALPGALASLRAANDGHPTDAEIAAMAYNSNTGSGAGMGLDPALNTITTPATNMQYEANWVGTDGVGNDLDGVEANLLDGQDAPFRIGYNVNGGTNNGGGHFMTMTDVRRDEAGNRTFLVSDPWSGATRWVSEADITSGAAFGGPTGTFQLGNANVSHTYDEVD